MISTRTRYRHCGFCVNQNVLEPFKDAAKQEQVRMARVIEQFLFSYVYCLDSTFVSSAPKIRRRSRRVHYTLTISADIYDAFVEKTRKEKMDMNLILEQFFINYIVFMKDMDCRKTKERADGEE